MSNLLLTTKNLYGCVHVVLENDVSATWLLPGARFTKDLTPKNAIQINGDLSRKYFSETDPCIMELHASTYHDFLYITWLNLSQFSFLWVASMEQLIHRSKRKSDLDPSNLI